MEQYVTIEEAAAYINVKRASLFNYMKALGIKTTHFKPDKRKAYLSSAQVELLKAYREKPWTVEVAPQVTIAEKKKEAA